jgi:hypothetical protein
MTLTTTLIATPDPDEHHADTSICPAGLPWCNDECRTYEGEDAGHHSSGFDHLDISRGARGETTLSMSVFRTDEDTPGPVLIFLGLDNSCDEMILTAAKARQLSAMLLDAADDADPLPLGVVPMQAQHVHLSDEVLTEDGWQTVVGQMAFDDQVNIWTDAEDRDPETDGWPFEPGDLVRVRRRIHGSCVIAFQEPTR